MLKVKKYLTEVTLPSGYKHYVERCCPIIDGRVLTDDELEHMIISVQVARELNESFVNTFGR